MVLGAIKSNKYLGEPYTANAIPLIASDNFQISTAFKTASAYFSQFCFALRDAY